MPPRQGLTEPEAVVEARRSGMIDNPAQGVLQQQLARGGPADISGNRQYPVILGYFTDQASTNTQAEFQTMLFSSASGAKSVNNFYRDMSYNAMSCSGKVDSWRTSDNTVAYYGNGNYGLTNGTTRNVYEFIRKVLVHADSTFNFADTNYDRDHDGYVDVLWVVHSGKGAEETGSTNDIWSHSASLLSFTGGTYYTTNDVSSFTGNPVRIAKYIIMPERTSYSGSGGTTIIGCGVFCHEFGHALGLPDLYDTGGYSISGQGLGNFSLMAGGSWGGNGSSNARPVALDLWCRRFLGWANPVRVTANGFYGIPAIMTTSSGSSYKLARLGADTTKQFWLIENRYRNAAGPVSTVRWDSLLAGQGLAIYHIDTTYTSGTYFTNNQVNVNTTNGTSRNRPYGVALEETDMTTAGYSSELWDGTNAGESADLWNSSTQANFDSNGTAYPVTYLNGTNPTTGGAHTLTAVRHIPAASAAMSCSLLVGVLAGVEGSSTTLGNPSRLALLGSVPNPARGKTNLSFQLPRTTETGISIFNVLGQEVKRFELGMLPPGRHSVEWNAAGAKPGVYFYRLEAGGQSLVGKLTVVR
jgi:M6 family metalloprotease-like protein